MLHTTARLESDFAVILQNKFAQAAEMVLGVGESTGGPDNVHENSDQWLFVVEGEGSAIVAGEDVPIDRHSLLLIERGEWHEIRNTGETPLRTLNLYVPPEY